MTLSNTQVVQQTVKTTSTETVTVKAEAPKAKVSNWNSRSVVSPVKFNFKNSFLWSNILGGASHI